ncbi:MAG: DeoR/GlpR family DNA-binding transcription regulator [Oscillospiraceae bacterium]|nr:DeoR/GlpR family DNA-binding transcription regulator [Oscillospiraceae bacterium]
MVERRASVLKYIQSKGEVSTDQLFSQFPECTPKTIRRDLIHWEQAGAILRSHGKARVNRQYLYQLEAQYSMRESENAQVKSELAAAAVGLLGGHNTLFLDAGTTTMALARQLPDKNFTILTAAPNIALTIVGNNAQCTVLLTGGHLNPKTLGCAGYSSADLIKQINIDLAFMAVSGFTIASGFMVGEYFESDLKRAVVAKSEQVILLMDSSKIGVSMPFTYARPSEVDIVICDRMIDSETESHLLSKGVKIIKV